MLEPAFTAPTSPDIKQEFIAYIKAELKYINEKTPDHIDFKVEIGRALQAHNYSNAITLVLCSFDNAKNIIWHARPAFHGHDVFIRDARNKRATNFLPHEYIMMGLNDVRATIDLLEIQKKEPGSDQNSLKRASQYISEAAISFCGFAASKTNEADTISCLEHLNGNLTNRLSQELKITYEEAKKKISTAKEFSNLKDPSRHLVTLTNLKNAQNEDVTFFEADLAQSALTPELQEEYLLREQKEWFKSLDTTTQKLINFYLPEILSEKRILPTQLRKELVGLRNCYHRLIGVFTEKNAKILLSIFHSGTVIHLTSNREEAQRIGVLHGKQLKAITNAKLVLALTTNSSINVSGNDPLIVKDSEYVMDKTDGLFSNLPLNALRVVSPCNYSGINEVLTFIADDFISKLQTRFDIQVDEYKILLAEITLYLQQPNKITDQTNVETAEKLQSLKKYLLTHCYSHSIDITRSCFILELAMLISFISNHNRAATDPNNRHLHLAALTNILISELNYYISIAINSSCESGKDRTGILMYYTYALVASHHLFNTLDLKHAQIHLQDIINKNLLIIAQAMHTGLLAGWQTACGTIGIKEDSKGVVPVFLKEVIDYLIRRPAKYNKEIITDDSFLRFYYPIGNRNLEVQKDNLLYAVDLLINYIKPQQNKSSPEVSPLTTVVNIPSVVATTVSSYVPHLRTGHNTEGNLTSTSVADIFPMLASTVSSFVPQSKTTALSLPISTDDGTPPVLRNNETAPARIDVTKITPLPQNNTPGKHGFFYKYRKSEVEILETLQKEIPTVKTSAELYLLLTTQTGLCKAANGSGTTFKCLEYMTDIFHKVFKRELDVPTATPKGP